MDEKKFPVYVVDASSTWHFFSLTETIYFLMPYKIIVKFKKISLN